MRCRRSCQAGSSLEDFALWRDGLLAVGREGLGIQFIELAEPFLRILNDRFEQHSPGHAPDPHAVPLKTKFPRQPHRLAAAILEKFGNIGLRHLGNLNPTLVYIKYIYQATGPWRRYDLASRISQSRAAPRASCLVYIFDIY